MFHIVGIAQEVSPYSQTDCGPICENADIDYVNDDEGEVSTNTQLLLAYTMILCGVSILVLNLRISIISEK